MKRGIISFLFIIVAVSIFIVWTRPQMKQTEKLHSQKAAIDNALANSIELQKIRDKILLQYNALPVDDLARLSHALPKNPEETKLMVEISNIAEANGAILESFQTKGQSASSEGRGTYAQKNSAETKPYKEIDIDLSFSSSYEALLSFIKTIQTSLRLIDIKEISFSAGEEDTYGVNLKAKAYYRK